MSKSVKPNERNAAQTAADAIQKMMSLSPAFGPQSMHFWKAQDQYLQEAEKFSTAWFKRRHDATQTALETAKQFANGEVPSSKDAMSALSEWQAHSIERLTEDAKEYTEMMARCFGSTVRNELEAADETEASIRHATTHKGTPV